tara:strand:+ start:466 stop:654 length:189 start_codon:yes stop_codon:yes gene_type:complete
MIQKSQLKTSGKLAENLVLSLKVLLRYLLLSISMYFFLFKPTWLYRKFYQKNKGVSTVFAGE